MRECNKRFTQRFLLGFLIGLLFGLVQMALGCASAPTNPAGLVKPNLFATPASLVVVSATLDWLIGGMILLVGVAVALYFLLPETHRLSGLLMVGGGSVLGLSLLLKTTLWMMPWVGGVLVIGGLALLGYELYLKFVKKDPNAFEIPST